jgi:replicative DNA helicase
MPTETAPVWPVALGPDRPVPADERTEAALLGVLLWDRAAVIDVADLIEPGDFAREHHGWVYAAVRDLYRRRVPPELITVQAELQTRGQLAALGGEYALQGLIVDRGVPAHRIYYAQTIARHAAMRRLISIGGAIAGLGYGDAADLPGVLAEAQALLASVTRGGPEVARRLGDAVAAVVTDLDERQTTGRIAGISSGFPTLDQHVYGWEPGQLILLAAQTKRGKTALAQHFAEAAAHAAVPVAVLSLEMEPEELARRHLARAAGLDLGQLRRATVGAAGWERLIAAQATLDPLPIWFLDAATVPALETQIHRLQADPARGCGLLIVDYLQLLTSPGPGNREQEVARIVIGLKRLARACQIPVLALSQFSRAADDRSAPQLRDLRESGALEQTANIVLALHRPDPTAPGRMELHILAQRDGEAELVIDLTWHGPTQTFGEADRPAGATWAH